MKIGLSTYFHVSLIKAGEKLYLIKARNVHNVADSYEFSVQSETLIKQIEDSF